MLNINKSIDLKLLSETLGVTIGTLKNILYASLTLGHVKATFTPCCTKCDTELTIHYISAFNAENYILETKPVCLGCGVYIVDKSKFFVKINFWDTSMDVGEIL